MLGLITDSLWTGKSLCKSSVKQVNVYLFESGKDETAKGEE